MKTAMKHDATVKSAGLGKKILGAGAALSMAFSLSACGHDAADSKKSASAKVGSKIGALMLSVNPEVKFAYDNQGNVVSTEGVNEDGKKLLENDDDYQGKHTSEAASAVVDDIFDDGYLDTQVGGHDKNIVILVEPGSKIPSEEFLDDIAEDVRASVAKNEKKSNVLTVKDGDLDDQQRIGVEKAREIVLAQLGLTDAQFSEGEYDLDDGIYEFEFTAGGVEYEYEVDARTGKVLEAERDRNDDWAAWDADDDGDDGDSDDSDDRGAPSAGSGGAGGGAGAWSGSGHGDDDWDDADDAWDGGDDDSDDDDWDDDADDADDWDDDGDDDDDDDDDWDD